MLIYDYKTEDFFDEMFQEDAGVRTHYRHIAARFRILYPAEHRRKQTAVDLSFMRGGVTFTV